jgi:hypothetical protein
MADNTLLNSGSGGDTIRDIDRGGVKTQVTQLDAGGASGESLVSANSPMPVIDEELEHILSQILAVARAQLFVLSHMANINISPNEFTNDDDQLF